VKSGGEAEVSGEKRPGRFEVRERDHAARV
jgi:hypothetical protein